MYACVLYVNTYYMSLLISIMSVEWICVCVCMHMGMHYHIKRTRVCVVLELASQSRNDFIEKITV